MRLMASWVALEDIQPDSGELEYYVGSHTLEDYLFDGHHKWMPFRSTECQQFVASLHARSQASGVRAAAIPATQGRRPHLKTKFSSGLCFGSRGSSSCA
jgi:hypothetical protein